ncbi:MAG: hypothetical protein J0L76_21645 [Rhodobacterales bacterium]|nr:hypothetical protein [Rhodobacterales bacterium]
MLTSLEEIQARVQAIFGAVDGTVLVVLKGHLLIEEILDEIIRKFVFHPEYLDAARLGFAQKLQIARSVSLDEHGSGMWEIALKLNILRNDLSHALHSEKRNQKTQAVIDVYYREADEGEHISLVRGQEEQVVLAFAISYFIGFLSSFKAEVERFREFVDGVDALVNPHRHDPA